MSSKTSLNAMSGVSFDMNENQNPEAEQDRKNRRFAVSANRGSASHRVRYVETGGAAVDTEECTFCQAVPDLDHAGGIRATQVPGRSDTSECAGNGAQTGAADSAQ
ncbi:hypothetical protein FIU96_09375 [Marinobacter sp. THAF39]|nr:hypothetical protein FIV08_09455 [Marinobacter sp. THAF197a]QFT50840.1 hypothetical protein FIU96_09375 [Marinobacter sp. THAF39]